MKKISTGLKALTVAAVAAAAVAVPATAASARGVNCTVTGGGTLGIISFTANITTNNCGFQVRSYIKAKYGIHGVNATEYYYGSSIGGTGTSKATMDITDSPLEWGYQVYVGGAWDTYATDNSYRTVQI